MAMLKKIAGIQLRAVYHSVISRSNKKPSKLKTSLIALLAVYVVATCAFSVGTIFYMMAGVIPGWMYFANLAVMAFGAAVMLTVFSCQAMLFDAKDNELLLALPVKPSHILGGRMIVVMLLEYMASLIIMLPAIGVYAWVRQPEVMFYPFAAVALLCLPLLGLTVSCILGYLVSLLTRKLGSKAFVTILYLAFIGLYMWGYTSLVTMANKAMLGGVVPSAALQKALPPMYRMGMALGEINAVSLIYFVLWCCVPFAAVCYVLSRSFIALATASRSGRKIVYVEKRMKKRGAFTVLLFKEFRRFITTPIYLLNSGFGFLLNVILGIIILIKGPGILGTMFEGVPELQIGALGMLCFLAAMSTTTAPSVSLEGKSLWILKSSPIRTQDILWAKLALNLIFGVPTLIFAGLCASYTVGATIVQAVVIVLIPISVQIFSAIMGLIFNLHFPKLDAVNETAMVKQSASVMLTLLCGFAVLGILITAYIYIDLPVEWLGMSALAIISAITVCAYKYLMNRGVRMFEEL